MPLALPAPATHAGATALGCAVLCLLVSPYLARLTVSVPDREMRDWWRGRPADTPVVVRTAVIAAVLGLLAGAAAGATALLPVYLWLALVGTPLTVIDIDHHRLPDRLVVVLAAGEAVLLSLSLVGGVELADWVRAIEAAAVVFGVLFLLAFASPESFGFGDVKLGAVLAGCLGVAGWPDVVYGFAAGFLLGALVALGVLATPRGGLKTAIPFGPMLILGALVVLALATVDL